MKKFLAEIFAAPFSLFGKVARTRMRGIFRYGPLRATWLYFQVRRNNTKPKYYLSICAIVKNEGAYFNEWLNWHKKHGVEKFYIYDNESDDGTKKILEPFIKSGIVEYTYFPGERMQIAAYDDCLARHRFDSRWIAFIDLDEFIVPIENKNIPEFLKPLENFSSVEINWLVYGSGGAKYKTDGDVMARFRAHSHPNDPINNHIKSIVNPRKITSFIGAHEAVALTGKTVDANGRKVRVRFFDRAPIGHDKIRINHYAVKSYEEFLAKRGRGWAWGAKSWAKDYFEKLDRNEIREDL